MIKTLPAESELETALPAWHPAKIHTMKLQILHPQICLAAVAGRCRMASTAKTSTPLKTAIHRQRHPFNRILSAIQKEATFGHIVD